MVYPPPVEGKEPTTPLKGKTPSPPTTPPGLRAVRDAGDGALRHTVGVAARLVSLRVPIVRTFVDELCELLQQRELQDAAGKSWCSPSRCT